MFGGRPSGASATVAIGSSAACGVTQVAAFSRCSIIGLFLVQISNTRAQPPFTPIEMSVRPGQNGPGSDAGSSTNSPALGGIKREDPTAMQLTGGAAAAGGGAHDDQSRDQDRLLPIANISRLMKRVLPDHAKMSKEAKAALQESVSEFIGFITSEASDRLVEEKRKTITGDDSQSQRCTRSDGLISSAALLCCFV